MNHFSPRFKPQRNSSCLRSADFIGVYVEKGRMVSRTRAFPDSDFLEGFNGRRPAISVTIRGANRSGFFAEEARFVNTSKFFYKSAAQACKGFSGHQSGTPRGAPR
jgi:hypothetical protein